MAKDEEPKSLAIGNISSIFSGLGEVFLDSLTNEGIVKDIPILGTLTGLYKSGVNVKESIFQKKVDRLINNVSSLSKEEINNFNFQFENDREFQIRVAEHLTLIIDRLDDLEKTKLLAKAFTSFIKNTIDFIQFRRIARAIERCMIEDLKELHNFERANDAFSEITYELAASGLIELVQLSQVQAPDAKSMYKITEFGELFVETVLKKI